jgi:hypothetical protein
MACLRPPQSTPGRLPPDRSPASQPEQAHARSLRRSLACTLHPFTHRDSTRLVRSAPPRQATSPTDLSAGRNEEDVSHRCLQPLRVHEHPLDRSTPESPRSELSPRERGFHAPAPGMTFRPHHGTGHDRVEPRLTPRVQLWRGLSTAHGEPCQSTPRSCRAPAGARRELLSIRCVIGSDME